MMTVTSVPFERYTYEVSSESHPGRKYRVILTANKGAGVCTCPNFWGVKQRHIDEGRPILTQETGCKHTRAALHHFIIELMPALAEAEDNEPSFTPSAHVASASHVRSPESLTGVRRGEAIL